MSPARGFDCWKPPRGGRPVAHRVTSARRRPQNVGDGAVADRPDADESISSSPRAAWPGPIRSPPEWSLAVPASGCGHDPAPRRDHRPRSSSSRRWATTSRPPCCCSPAAAVVLRDHPVRRERFTTRIAAEVKGFDDGQDRAPPASTKHANRFAPRRRRAGDTTTPGSGRRRDGDALGPCGRRADDDRRVSTRGPDHRALRRRRRTRHRPAADRPVRATR